MRKFIILTLSLALTISMLTAINVPVKIEKTSVTTTSRELKVLRDDWQTIFEDDFEGENLNWTTSEDAEAPGETWHISTEGFEGNGWIMQDPEINGYHNDRYIVMDTPSITVPENANLTFKMKMNVEGLGTSGDFNGWDGFNVRIKVGDGEWQVLTNPTPAYSATSFFSFGNIWGEGVGIPAWGGEIADWTDVSFSLSQYSGQSVQIRFAFASDGAACTVDDGGNSNWYGVKVDNIAVGDVFSSNGDSETEMTSSYLTQESFWVIEDNAGMNNTRGLKNPLGIHRNDAIISPEINVPTGGQVFLQYDVKCDLEDANGDNNDNLEDYYIVFAKRTTDEEWTKLHYLWCSSNGPGPTTPLPLNTWQHVDQMWVSTVLLSTVGPMCNLSEFTGSTVQLKFIMITDGDDNGGTGTGVYIDNVKVEYEQYQPCPNNLTATENNGNVELNWEDPIAYVGNDLVYASEQYNAILSQAVPIAVRIDNEENVPVKLGSVNFKMYTTTDPENIVGNIDVKIWENNNNLPGALLHTFTGFNGMIHNRQFKADISSNNIMIPANSSIFVGVDNYSDHNYQQGIIFETIENTGHTFITQDGGATWTNAEVFTTNNNDHFTNSSVGATVLQASSESPNPDSYKVYHKQGNDFVEIASGITETSYTHTEPNGGTNNLYYTTAVYGTSESTPSNTASIFIYPESSILYSYDDGTAESSSAPELGTIFYNKFDFNGREEVNALYQIKIYVETIEANKAIVCVLANSNNDNLPGQVTRTIRVENSNMVLGWNIIEIPEPVADELNYNRPIYIGVKGTTNTNPIGIDTGSEGHSYMLEAESDTAEMVNHTYMIRAYSITMNNNAEAPNVNSLNANNQPNPFNPKTLIRYNVPVKGNVKLNIYNLQGKKIKTLVNTVKDFGIQEAVWNGTDDNDNTVSSGIYFYKIETGKQSITKKMLLMK